MRSDVSPTFHGEPTSNCLHTTETRYDPEEKPPLDALDSASIVDEIVVALCGGMNSNKTMPT